MPAIAGRSAVGLPRYVPGALAVSEFSSAALRRRFAQPECAAIRPRGLYAHLAQDGRTGRTGAHAAYRHVEHDGAEAAVAAARCQDQAGCERDGTASALPAARAV